MADRASAQVHDGSFTSLRFDEEIDVICGGIVGTHAGDMIGEVGLAIEMGADAVDIGKSVHRTPRWARASAWRRK